MKEQDKSTSGNPPKNLWYYFLYLFKKKKVETNTDSFPRTLECKWWKKKFNVLWKSHVFFPRVLHSLVRLACHSVSLNQHNTVYFTCSETSAESLKWRQIQLKPTTHFCCVLVWCDIRRLLHWSFQQIVAQQLYKQTEPQFLNSNIIQIIHKYKWSIVILDLILAGTENKSENCWLILPILKAKSCFILLGRSLPTLDILWYSYPDVCYYWSGQA